MDWGVGGELSTLHSERRFGGPSGRYEEIALETSNTSIDVVDFHCRPVGVATMSNSLVYPFLSPEDAKPPSKIYFPSIPSAHYRSPLLYHWSPPMSLPLAPCTPLPIPLVVYHGKRTSSEPVSRLISSMIYSLLSKKPTE